MLVNELDAKYRMHKITGLKSMKRFCCHSIVRVYDDTALRHPNASDMDRLLDEGNFAGFPGCIWSIDCMHREWNNCPTRRWKGMFQAKSGVATVILEAIADAKCRFWHFNFGAPGTLNGIKNVLDRSPLLDMAVRGESPSVEFTANGNDYKHAYWFADGIYPIYACFAKPFPRPVTRMQKLIAVAQEAKRKDIERAFGILQARFLVILTSSCRLLWQRHATKTVIAACVILHNLIIDYQIEHVNKGAYIKEETFVPQHPYVFDFS